MANRAIAVDIQYSIINAFGPDDSHIKEFVSERKMFGPSAIIPMFALKAALINNAKQDPISASAWVKACMTKTPYMRDGAVSLHYQSFNNYERHRKNSGTVVKDYFLRSKIVGLLKCYVDGEGELN